MSGQSPIFQYEMMAGGFEEVTAEDVASDIQGLKFFGKTENEQLNDEANDDSIYAISQKISGLEIQAGTGEITSENVIVQADKFIQTADAGQRFILRLGIVAVPVVAIGAAYILIKRKYIIDERKYEELVAEINRGKGV